MKYIIVPIDAKTHKSPLIRFWKAYIQKYFNGRFEWMYKDNPWGSAKTHLAFNEDENEILGCASIMPRTLYIKDQKISAGVAIDYIVHEQHRIYGPALKLQRANFSDENVSEFDIIIAFPNQAAKGPFLKAGCKILGEASLFTKVLKSEKKLARYIKIPVLTKSTAFMVDHVLRIVDKLRVAGKSSDWHREDLYAFDERNDIFWNELRKNYKILADRSSDYLQWRYINCKGPEYRIFCLSERTTGSITGYVIYFLHNDVANIEDMFAIDKDKTWLYLLNEFSEHMREKGAASICFSYFGNTSLKKWFRKLNFFEKKETRTALIYINKRSSESFRKMLLNPNHWILFEGDLDL